MQRIKVFDESVIENEIASVRKECDIAGIVIISFLDTERPNLNY